MKTKIRKIGNSTGVILSKKLLEETNITMDDELELLVEGNKITIKKITKSREGWEEQFLNAGSKDDHEEILTFSNNFDEKEWTW